MTKLIKNQRGLGVVQGSSYRSFLTDVFAFSGGTLFTMLIGIVQGLIIPKYLSMTDYGYWKLFFLYAGYVGFLHLGFVNGAYIRWAGKEANETEGEIGIASRFLLLEQFVVIVSVFIIFNALLHSFDLRFIGSMVLLFAFLSNFAGFFGFIMRAMKRFKILTLLNVGNRLIFFLVVCFFDYYATVEIYQFNNITFGSQCVDPFGLHPLVLETPLK